MKKKQTFLDALAWFIIVAIGINFLVLTYLWPPTILLIALATGAFCWAFLHLILKDE